MARMKIEVQAARAEKFGLSLHDKMIGYLPRYASQAASVSWLMNLRDMLPGVPELSEKYAGFAARRSLPKWRSDWFRDPATQVDDPNVVLFADTFDRYFERETIDAALAVLATAGYRVQVARPDSGRPLCCGRTFLSVGAVSEARAEMERTLAALAPYAEKNIPIIGLEPSCLFSFRDEVPALIKSDAAEKIADQAMLFEEFLAREARAGRLALPLRTAARRALLHGHCHQKSFGVMSEVEQALRLVPGLTVEPIESSCCGMAGSFGYDAETIDVSLAMGELALLPTVRRAPDDAIIVADGTSCRHQIKDGTQRDALHVARVLQMFL